MRAVSLGGYVPSCLAVAIVCGFGGRLRLGVTLILAIVFADAMTIAAKGAFAAPRPHAVEARVRTFGAFESGLPPMATGTSVPADDFGFPSGHVATTAAWALGLAWSRRKPWQVGVAATWVALMALSRMYPGTPFPRGRAWRPRRRCRGAGPCTPGASSGWRGHQRAHGRYEDGPWRRRSSSRSRSPRFPAPDSALMMPAVSVASWARPSCSCTRGALDDSVPPATRMARMAVALVLLGAALWSSTWTITTRPGLAVMSTMAVSAALHASVLLVPALALGGNRS